MSEKSIFLTELQSLINKYSKENGSNTPDHVLALYLGDCLNAFDRAVISRDKNSGEKNKKETITIEGKPIW